MILLQQNGACSNITEESERHMFNTISMTLIEDFTYKPLTCTYMYLINNVFRNNSILLNETCVSFFRKMYENNLKCYVTFSSLVQNGSLKLLYPIKVSIA